MDAHRIRCTTLLAACLVVFATRASTQDFRGEAIRVTTPVDPVELSEFRFLTFTFGREGPMETPLKTLPVRGRDYFVDADVFGIESVASIRFDLVDAAGRSLQTLHMWKATDSARDWKFYGFVTVPSESFRVVASGADRGGAAFRSMLDTMFEPATTGPPEPPIPPPGIPANLSGQLQDSIAAYRQELKTRHARAGREHPDGVIPLTRAQVSRIAYEPLPSPSGNPIGMRVRYSIQFSASQTIAAVPLVFQVDGSRGVVEMKPLAGSVTPAPRMLGVGSLDGVILYHAAATYQAGTTYSFTVDLVPDYIVQGKQTGRFCIYEQKFTNRSVWDALMASPTPVPYSVSISDTDTNARIPEFFPQRTFYQSFKTAGAVDCGPLPNNRF